MFVTEMAMSQDELKQFTYKYMNRYQKKKVVPCVIEVIYWQGQHNVIKSI